jgi:hypothetical protein
MITHWAAALAFMMLLFAPATLPAQRWERLVQDRLDRAIAAIGSVRGSGVLRRSGTLNQEEAATMEAPAAQGRAYALVAVCDDDCSRLQLTLINENGSEVATDRRSENLPTLRFTPDRSMTYRVRVVMEGCHWNPCWFGVALVPLGKTLP